jgi:archaemetzincin
VPERGQYYAEAFLAATREVPAEHVLGVTECDLFVERLNFVFGLADMAVPAAVISLNRLRYGAEMQTFRQRAAKEAVHELGHTLGLQHCPDPSCVMHFSNSLQDTDDKSEQFCSRCRQKLAGKWPTAH